MKTLLEEVAARVEGAVYHAPKDGSLEGVSVDGQYIVYSKSEGIHFPVTGGDMLWPSEVRDANRLLDAYEAVRAERIAKRVAELVDGCVERFGYACDVVIDTGNEGEIAFINCQTGIVGWTWSCSFMQPMAKEPTEATVKLRAAFEQAKREVDG